MSRATRLAAESVIAPVGAPAHARDNGNGADNGHATRPAADLVAAPALPAKLSAHELYINREISWLAFNKRVLEEAWDERHPLLERVKFLAIFGDNLDEFFMIRVSGLQAQRAAGVADIVADGLTPTEALLRISRTVSDLMGKDPEARFKFIMEEAYTAKDIDI